MLVLTLCALASAALAPAQFDSAIVLGRVHDPNKAVVYAAAVTLVNVKPGVSVQTATDANGNYEFVNQRLGAYRVRVAMSGFQNAESEPLRPHRQRPPARGFDSAGGAGHPIGNGKRRGCADGNRQQLAWAGDQSAGKLWASTERPRLSRSDAAGAGREPASRSVADQ